MQCGVVEILESWRRVTPSRLTVSYVVICLSLNYKVSIYMSINSLMKKTYNIVYSLCSLQSFEAHLGIEPLEVNHREREEI
jgi:hypothetical protein